MNKNKNKNKIMIAVVTLLCVIGIFKDSIPVQAQQDQQYYEVKAGDTLYRIAINYRTTVEALMKDNQIYNPRTLQIGKRLYIPSKQKQIVLQLDKVEDVKIQKVMEVTLTAYTAGIESTGKTPSHPQYGITYSGTTVQEGRTIAVDPKVIPLGTTVFIEGIGWRTAEDIGSAIKGNKIDVYMDDVKQAIQFGVQKNRRIYWFDS